MNNKVIVVGSINTDLIIKTSRFPKPGETIIGGSFSKGSGGKGANQAVAASRAGAQVSMISRVGNDSFGQDETSSLRTDHIETGSVTIDGKESTGTAFIFVDAHGENSIVVASGANANLHKEDISASAAEIASAGVLLVQLETPVDGVDAALREAKKSGVLTILNPAPAQPLTPELLRNVDILTPNVVEAEMLSGMKIDDDISLRSAAGKLLAHGIGTVVITLGSRGVLLASEKEMKIIPAFKVNAVDTTGAGDVFSGTLAACICGGMTMEGAVQRAIAAASFSVTKMGAQSSIPFPSELENFIARYSISGQQS